MLGKVQTLVHQGHAAVKSGGRLPVFDCIGFFGKLFGFGQLIIICFDMHRFEPTEMLRIIQSESSPKTHKFMCGPSTTAYNNKFHPRYVFALNAWPTEQSC